MLKQCILMLMSSLMLLQLAGCNSTQSGSRLIASVFNTSTQIQKQFIDRHAPKDVAVTNNIQYMQNPALHLDLYQPSGMENLAQRPVVVWIHGGGWISGSKEHARGYFKRLASQGYSVVSIQYQFAPEVIYPAQLMQINQALAYLQQNAQHLKLNTNSIFLAGDSAGANMASHYAVFVTNTAYSQAEDFQPAITKQQLKGLILHCGIYDMKSFVQTAPEEIKLLEWGIYNLVQAYTGERKHDMAFLERISPQYQINADYPPVLISGGNKDFLTDSQSLPFAEALKSMNIPVTEVFYPDSKELLVHEYQFMMGKKASQQTFEQTIDFLDFNAF
jgi:acetyl esterase/lipase